MANRRGAANRRGVARRRGPQRKRGGAGFPLFLLVTVILAVPGGALWLRFAPEEYLPPPPKAPGGVEIALGTAPESAGKPPLEAPTRRTTVKPPVARKSAPAKPPAAKQRESAVKPPKGMARPKEKDKAKAKPSKAKAKAKVKPIAPKGPAKRRTTLKIVRGKTSPGPHDPALVRRSPQGLLPVTGANGRRPWKAYARPFDRSDKRPRIAIVIAGLGLSPGPAGTAIDKLPGEVTLTFTPYASRLGGWVRRARNKGHEVLLGVPMEPHDFPESDPGPKALLIALDAKQNEQHLLWSLGRTTGYVGVAPIMGSRFTMSRRHLSPVFKNIRRRGLMYLDTRAAPNSAVPEIAGDVGLPWVESSLVFDAQPSRDAIDAELEALEKIAKRRGRSVGMGSAFPITLERVAAWAKGLEGRGLVLAPITALARGGALE